MSGNPLEKNDNSKFHSTGQIRYLSHGIPPLVSHTVFCTTCCHSLNWREVRNLSNSGRYTTGTLAVPHIYLPHLESIRYLYRKDAIQPCHFRNPPGCTIWPPSRNYCFSGVSQPKAHAGADQVRFEGKLVDIYFYFLILFLPNFLD